MRSIVGPAGRPEHTPGPWRGIKKRPKTEVLGPEPKARNPSTLGSRPSEYDEWGGPYVVRAPERGVRAREAYVVVDFAKQNLQFWAISEELLATRGTGVVTENAHKSEALVGPGVWGWEAPLARPSEVEEPSQRACEASE